MLKKPAHIGLVTCADLSHYFPSSQNPLLTHDDQVLFNHLQAKGHKVEPWVWSHSFESLREKAFDLLIVRSTWDYSTSEANRRAFMAWLDRLAAAHIPLANPAALMRWNIDKKYLLELAQMGVAIPPTRLVPAGSDLETLAMHFRDFGSLVLKPCISAAGRDTYRARNISELTNLSFGALQGGRDFLAQPYIQDIEEKGEWSLVFFGNRYSHAVLKKPKPKEWLVQDERGGSVHWQAAPASLIDFAEGVVQKIVVHRPDYCPLYQRIDVMIDGNQYLLGEIELIEPELFFLDRRQTPYQGYLPALELFEEAIFALDPCVAANA